MGAVAGAQGVLDRRGPAAESGVCGAVGRESHGERVVFFADWEGWWVLFFFSFSGGFWGGGVE